MWSWLNFNIVLAPPLAALILAPLLLAADGKTATLVRLGEPGEGDKEASLTGKGRKLIGMHVKLFGSVHAIALVTK